MKIPENILCIAAFVTYFNHVSKEYVPVGTAFFLAADSAESLAAHNVYAVTARHVIDALHSKGVADVFLRHNLVAPLGSATMVVQKIPLDSWYSHPTDASIDVAVARCGIPDNCSERVLPFSRCVTEDKLQSEEVDLGDEVFVVGLFKHHSGKRKNVPIVRVGNLAARNEERVSTKLGEMDAYLIESRSIGGLSGSPVFLNLGTTRHIKGLAMQTMDGSPIFYLLGLIHGHFDVLTANLTSAIEDEGTLKTEKINSGIAIVTPIHHVLKVIEEVEKATQTNLPDQKVQGALEGFEA